MTARMWIPVDIEHRGRGDWWAYVPSISLFVPGRSEADLKARTSARVEEATGLHNFVLVWREVN